MMMMIIQMNVFYAVTEKYSRERIFVSSDLSQFFLKTCIFA